MPKRIIVTGSRKWKDRPRKAGIPVIDVGVDTSPRATKKNPR